MTVSSCSHVVGLRVSFPRWLKPSHSIAHNLSADVHENKRDNKSGWQMAREAKVTVFCNLLISQHFCSLLCLETIQSTAHIPENRVLQACMLTLVCVVHRHAHTPRRQKSLGGILELVCHIDLSQSYNNNFVCICITFFFDLCLSLYFKICCIFLLRYFGININFSLYY